MKKKQSKLKQQAEKYVDRNIHVAPGSYIWFCAIDAYMAGARWAFRQSKAAIKKRFSYSSNLTIVGQEAIDAITKANKK